jgi:hypothetical protein
MFSSRTLFVLGAGASAEFELPTGQQLATDIAKRLRYRFDQRDPIEGDREIYEALGASAQPDPHRFHEYIAAAQKIAGGISLTKSIDTFMDIHKENAGVQLCGKLAIVSAISAAEKKSRLYVDPSKGKSQLDFLELGDTWVVKWFKTLCERIELTGLDRLFDQVSFINFNYDRCLEHFLVRAVGAAYDERRAVEVMERLNIVHPYGVIGELPWQSLRDTVPYGGHEGDPHMLLSLSQKIRTYTERVEEGAELNTIRQAIADAEVIVFLGFAFHPQNMELLAPTEAQLATMPTKRVYATAYQMSADDCRVVYNKLFNMFHGRATGGVNVQPITCSGLFDFYSLSLSA